MTGPERDPDVDAWLKVRRPQLRAGDLAQSLEPPQEIDRLIIDRARRELRQSPTTGHGFFRSSPFSVPVSIAATLVLSFTLVLQFNRYESQQAAAATLADSPNAPALTLESLAEPPQALQPVAAPSLARSIARANAEAAAARSTLAAKTHPSSAVSGSNVSASEVSASGKAEAAATTAAPSLSALSSERAAIQADIPGAEDSRSPRSRRDFEADKAAGAAVLRAAPADAARPSLLGAPPPAPLPQVVLPATQWWAEVQKLQNAGRTADAARELAALRKAYPDFVVPTSTAPAGPTAPPPPSAVPESPRQ